MIEKRLRKIALNILIFYILQKKKNVRLTLQNLIRAVKNK